MKYHVLGSILLLLMCSHACKRQHQDTTATTSFQVEQEEVDSTELYLEQLRQEKQAKLDLVAKFIIHDFDAQNTHPAHPNFMNVQYFKNLDGKLPWDTDFSTHPNYVKRIKTLTGDTYKDIAYINSVGVASPVKIKANFFALGVAEAHNAGFNNYKILYDLEKDIFAVVHYWHDFDTDEDHTKVFIEQPNRYTESQFYTLFHWVRATD